MFGRAWSIVVIASPDVTSEPGNLSKLRIILLVVHEIVPLALAMTDRARGKYEINLARDTNTRIWLFGNPCSARNICMEAYFKTS